MIVMVLPSVSFHSAVMPSSASSHSSTCAPISRPKISKFTNQPSCFRLKVSKNSVHSVLGISFVFITNSLSRSIAQQDYGAPNALLFLGLLCLWCPHDLDGTLRMMNHST